MTTTVDAAIESVLSGRVEDYATIVRAYQDDVWRICTFALRDPAATEDIVQQVFVAAYQSLDRYQRGRSFGAWLRTIARNQVKNELRRASRERDRLRRYGDLIEQRMADDRLACEREERIREALARCEEGLPAEAVEALALRYRQSLSFEEVADRLGRTVNAARQLLYRTRVSLRACIEERMASA